MTPGQSEYTQPKTQREAILSMHKDMDGLKKNVEGVITKVEKNTNWRYLLIGAFSLLTVVVGLFESGVIGFN